MKKLLVNELASEELKLGNISGGNNDDVSQKSRAVALALNIASLPTAGVWNPSYTYQGKPIKSVLNFGLFSTIYNTAHLLAGTQTDAEGKKIKKWW